jgi:N-acetylmuramoyl-L-alanine amidase
VKPYPGKFEIITDLLDLIGPVKREINTLVIHHSASLRNTKCVAQDIERWHLQRGFREIGYHFVLRGDGHIQVGRDMNKIGAHVKGYNADSIGICAIGNFSETDPVPLRLEPQFINLARLVNRIVDLYPDIKIVGHRELTNTQCPGMKINLDQMRNYFKAVRELQL